MIVTGIGTRNPPANIAGVLSPRLESVMRQIGEVAKERNWRLRSGGADGMDLLFEYLWSDNKEIYIGWNGFNGRHHGKNGAICIEDPAILQQAEKLAKSIHPNWRALKTKGKQLHTRNIFQVLGGELDLPSDICIYLASLTPDGDVSGGTRTAVTLCKRLNIPTYNLLLTQDIIDLGEALDIKWNDSTLT